jgi:SAM-dependent methyltransferase
MTLQKVRNGRVMRVEEAFIGERQKASAGPRHSERALREREQYNKGLKRRTYNAVFSHTGYYYRLRREEILREQLLYANDRHVLELGSRCWVRWIEGFQIHPHVLECINISEKELQKGIDKAKTSRVKPRFFLMDANHLEFADDSFDMVFGSAILHHLDFARALDEIQRVLKSQGRMLFIEPLDNNPVGKVVRLLTPQARTRDEQPLRMKEIAEIQRRFDTTFFYEKLLSIPLGLVSKVIFSNPDNILMKSAYKIDRFIDTNYPPLRNLYRSIIIVGVNKKVAGSIKELQVN